MRGFIEDTHPGITFGHMINPAYASLYYGYQWTLVYACDLFTEFEKHGIMNKEVGKRYRDIILAPGPMKSANEKLKEFLGREPTEDAYFRMHEFN